jgi:hypothetical protein
LEVKVVILSDKRIVDEFAYAFGLSVGALAEIEVVGGGFDEEGKSIRRLRGRGACG